MSAQTNLPWSNHTFLDEGHTIPADVFEELSHGRFPAVLLLQSPPGAPAIAMPSFRGLPIRMLWMVLAMDSGSDAMIARLRKANVGWKHQFNRASLV